MTAPASLVTGGYLLPERHHHALERAQRAASLLASIDATTGYRAAIEPDLMAAVADYIDCDLRNVLADAVYLPPATSIHSGGTSDPHATSTAEGA